MASEPAAAPAQEAAAVVAAVAEDSTDAATRKAIEKILAQLEAAPVGIRITHSPAKVTSVSGPLKGDWKYKWKFRTDVEAIDQPLTVTGFGILGWDGEKWGINPAKFNSGMMPRTIFADWYSAPGGKLTPGTPATDATNWAGSHTRTPFRQRWFVLAKDKSGKTWKGEQIVELDLPPDAAAP